MTTDDGLKGLTDAQLVALYSELRHTSKEFCGLPHPMKNWTEEHDAAIANAARAWLAANVHDSGDGERYRFLRDTQATIIYKRNAAGGTWEPLIDTRETSTRCGSLDEATDKAMAEATTPRGG